MRTPNATHGKGRCLLWEGTMLAEGRDDACGGKGRRLLREGATLAEGKADASRGVWECRIRKAGQPALGHPASIGYCAGTILFHQDLLAAPDVDAILARLRDRLTAQVVPRSVFRLTSYLIDAVFPILQVAHEGDVEEA